MKALKKRIIKRLNDIIDDIDETFENKTVEECESELGTILFHVETEAESLLADIAEVK